MNKRSHGLFGSSSNAIFRLNYEAHLIQHGLGSFAIRHPWFGLPVAVVGLALLWLAYWLFYVPFLVLTSLTGIWRSLLGSRGRS